MKVLIEAIQGSKLRARYDEANLCEKSRYELRTEYPFCYGFILQTGAQGTDSLDCFLLSYSEFKIGDIVDCKPRDVFILTEGTEQDIKILATVIGEKDHFVLEKCREEIEIFLIEVFKEWPEVSIFVGPLLGKRRAFDFLESNKTSIRNPTIASTG